MYATNFSFHFNLQHVRFNSNKYLTIFNDKYQLLIKMTHVSDLQVQLHRSVAMHVRPKQRREYVAICLSPPPPTMEDCDMCLICNL